MLRTGRASSPPLPLPSPSPSPRLFAVASCLPLPASAALHAPSLPERNGGGVRARPGRTLRSTPAWEQLQATQGLRGTARSAARGGQGGGGSEEAEPGSQRLPCLLSIAGSDSGAGAGIQADIKAAAAQGVWCSTAVAGLTAQNTLGVQAAHPTPPDFLLEQMRSVLTDIGADAVSQPPRSEPAAVQ